MPLRSWLSTSYVRHFPSTPARSRRKLAIDIARNEQFSFQVCLRNDREAVRDVNVKVDGPAGWDIRVRRVGYVPLRHHNTPTNVPEADIDGRGVVPGLVPDPLFDEDRLLLPGNETHAFWITVKPGRKTTPGKTRLVVRVQPDDGKPRDLEVNVRVYAVRLRRRRNFPITHWFYVDSLIDWYRTDLFDKRFWEVLEKYIRNVVDHGQDTLYVPVFTPPLDGVKRPSQLLRVARTAKDKYSFDWRDVRKYIGLARKCGIRHFEWCHPFTQWGVAHAIRIYQGQGADEKLLWPPATSATGPVYRRFLEQYLPQLKRFLEQEKILRTSFFHVSDEPHGEADLANYRKARKLLAELAPWMKVMDALSEIEYGRRQLTDMPIPSIRVALDFVAENIPCWCYYCCGPREEYLNRLLDTPLAKIAMHGLLFYRWPCKGFLHWGYNYWYECRTRNLVDPYAEQDGLKWPNWAYGDPFVVYPGPNGPIDSIRWEVFAEALQDYQLLQAVKLDRDHRLLQPLKSFSDFPKTADWRRQLRRKLLQTAGGG